MARIRTIKPEFWSDGNVRRLSDSTALFFVSLWTFSDDFGFFKLDTLELSQRTSRWRSQNLLRMLTALSNRGLIRLSTQFKVGQVVGWKHQRIRYKNTSNWNEKEIVWDEPKDDAPTHAKMVQGLERKGKDRYAGREDAQSAPSAISAETFIESKKEERDTKKLKNDSGLIHAREELSLGDGSGDLDPTPRLTARPPRLPLLAELWNANCGPLSKVRGCSGTRKKHAEARWKETPDAKYWCDLIQRIAQSKFCTGSGTTAWRADFDFFIKPDTRFKIEEGKYDDRKTQSKSTITFFNNKPNEAELDEFP